MPEIRVAFFLGQVGWLGGVNYFRNLFAAIQSVPGVKIRPVIFAGLQEDISSFEGLAEVVRTPILDRHTFAWWVSKFLIKIFPRRDYSLYLFLRKHRIDLISHYCLLWRGCAIPSIGWIPDFQHRHLPRFFDKNECEARDRQFMDIICRSKAIILSSKDALHDLSNFCMDNETSAHVLRFVPLPHHKLDELPARAELLAKYKIDRPWFYIPNQFWAHKNHDAVVEALRLLKEQGNRFLVLATGSTVDSRNDIFFPSLMDKVARYGLQKYFRPLGIVPYSDVVALMRYSVAMINPSLFEGWSTSVEEAKAMGKKIILSDIAVHREQNPERGFYFEANDHNALAKQMIAVAQQHNEAEEAIQQEKAQINLIRSMENFAKRYEKIVLQVLEK